tara:strand:- start:107 stop:1504 length:1398 start_codon:yes stop_codon:yes gene_type:complete
MKKWFADARFLTWVGMAIRGLILFLLLTYAGLVLPANESTVFMMLITITAMQGVMDLGFIPSFTRVIAYIWSNKSNNTSMVITGFDFKTTNMNEVMTVFKWLYLRLSCLFLLLMMSLGTLTLLGPVAKLGDPSIGWLSWSITVVGSIFLFSQSRYAAILTGCNQIPILKVRELQVNIPLLILLTLGYYYKVDVVWVVLLLNVGYIGLFVTTKRQVDRLLGKETKNNGGELNHNLLRAIFQSAWRSGLGVLMTMGTISGSALMVAQLESPENGSAYLIAQRLIIAISGYCFVPFLVLIPKISALYASGNNLELISLAQRTRGHVLWLTLIGGVGFLYLSDVILPFLEYSFRFVSSDIWLLMVAYSLVERAGATNLQIQTSSNRVKWHIANGVSGILMLLIIPLAYAYFGLLGIPLSFFLSYLFFYYPYSVYLMRQEFGVLDLLLEVRLVLLPIMVLVVISFFYNWS